jgi:hypothetical protein
MTCLINARAYRDGSAAAPRWPDTSYWVLLGLSWACTRAHRASLYRARGFRDGAPRVRVCRGHRSSQRLREFLQSIFVFPCGPGGGSGVGPGWVRGRVLGRVLGRPFGIQLAVAGLTRVIPITKIHQILQRFDDFIEVFQCHTVIPSGNVW